MLTHVVGRISDPASSRTGYTHQRLSIKEMIPKLMIIMVLHMAHV